MVTEPAYLRNLKVYAKARTGVDNTPEAAVADIIAESDRGAIILAATGIEDILEDQIMAKLPGSKGDDDGYKRLFENDGSIASFSKKNWMAYAMGIVDEAYRKKIDLIREIRNACAHSRKPISMKDEVLSAPCKVVIADFLPVLSDSSPEALRHAFVLKCSLIIHYVLTGEKVEGPEAIRRRVMEAIERAPKPGP
jgi:hypothetical protein